MTNPRRPTLAEAAAVFRDAFTDDPGVAELDDEQPVSVHVTLGAWRRLDRALSAAGDERIAALEYVLRRVINASDQFVRDTGLKHGDLITDAVSLARDVLEKQLIMSSATERVE